MPLHNLQPAPVKVYGFEHGSDPRNNSSGFTQKQNTEQNKLNNIHGGKKRTYTKGKRTHTKGKRTYTKGKRTHTKGKRTYKKGKRTYKKGKRTYKKGKRTYKKGGGSSSVGRAKTAVVPQFSQVGPAVSPVGANSASINNNQAKINSLNDAVGDCFATNSCMKGGLKKSQHGGRRFFRNFLRNRFGFDKSHHPLGSSGMGGSIVSGASYY